MYSIYIFENLEKFSSKSWDNLEINLEYSVHNFININIYIDKLR
jgi:hypothetical protein